MPQETDRREFLKTGLITTAALIASGPAFFGPNPSWALEPVQAGGSGGPDVVISHGRNPEVITRAAVDALGGMKRFVKPGAKVVIKPNMSFASGPQSAANTHPAVVSEVAKMCAESGASRILVLDNVLHQPQDCLKLSKIAEHCQNIPKTGVHVIKGQRMFKEVKVENGVVIKSMAVASDLLDSDVLIAVPVGKSHVMSGVSLSMKGMMGLILDRQTFHRQKLHEAIVDMVTLLKPHLVVIDGTRILTTGGPGGPGTVVPLNLVIASPDMVAADAQMVALGTWYGKKVEPAQVKHIRIAAQRGLGRMDVEKLDVKNITA